MDKGRLCGEPELVADYACAGLDDRPPRRKIVNRL